MKRVLIITYYWPPSGGAGVQRWLKFVKYLRKFHWEPVIYTPSNPEYPETDHSLEKDIPPGIETIRQPIWEPYASYKLLQGQKKEEKINAAFLSEKKKNPFLENLSVWIRGNFFIPDARKFWIKPSVIYLTSYLKTHPIDVLVSTGPPHSMHLIAMPLAQHFKIPWLADFRDPWTNIDFYKDLKLTAWADQKHRKLESKVLKTASLVTVISQTMASDMQSICQRKYEVITNGYDEEDMLAEKPVLDRKFSIAHIGTLVSSRNPFVLWDTLKSCIDEIPGFAQDLEIKLVGKVDISVIESLRIKGLEKYLHKIDYLTHDAVLTCQRQSQLLLLIINDTPNAKMILTGKFFEYLAAHRPILALGPVDGDAAMILNETQAGKISGFHDTVSIKEHLLHYYALYKAGKLEVDSKDIQKYSREKLTESLSLALKQVISS